MHFALALLQIDQALLREDQRKALPISGCKPLFVIYKVRSRVSRSAQGNLLHLDTLAI